MPADDDVRTDEVSQQTIEGAARAKRAGGSTSKRLKTGPGPSTTDLHARAGPLSSMNALRSFADLDASQHPRLASLKRYDGVSLGGDLPLLSPGAAYGGARVACMAGRTLGDGLESDDCGPLVLVGSGRHLYGLGCGSGDGENSAGLERGKGGHVYLPLSDRKARAFSRVDSLSCRSEIQSVSLASGDQSAGAGSRRVLVTDSYGRGVCGVLSVDPGDAGGAGDADGSINGVVDVQGAYSLTPNDSLVCMEGGLTAGAVSDTSSYSVISRHFPKDLTVFDGDVVVRTFHTLENPNSVKMVGETLVTVAEGNLVTVYDLRIADRQTRVARMQSCGSASRGHIYALAVRGEGSVASGRGAGAPGSASCPLLGAGGEDRDVHVWDPRVWKSITRWSNCLKYEITSLHFLDSDPRYCLVSGMDYEVACGSWFENKSKAFNKSLAALGTQGRAAGPITEAGSVAEAQRQSRVVASYRCQSRWIGMSKLDGEDVFVGVSTDGKVYQSSFSIT
jgi:hypothetical protein